MPSANIFSLKKTNVFVVNMGQLYILLKLCQQVTNLDYSYSVLWHEMRGLEISVCIYIHMENNWWNWVIQGWACFSL